ncbi:MAG TPA: hypothetical protein VFS49_00295 [Croceibacterium sp.]|nr:hypothetical protein [Croceibacterium sp.]
MSNPTIVDVLFELVEQMPRKVQLAIAWAIAAALFTFLVFLGYLAATGALF